MRRNTRRFIVNSIENLNLSEPFRYERYYINDNLRIQKKKDKYIKEILDNENNLISKSVINETEFNELKGLAYSEIIRDGYLYFDDKRNTTKSLLRYI